MPTWKDPEVAAMREMFAAIQPTPGAPPPTWPERRMQIDAMGAAAPLPEGVTAQPITLGGVPAERVTAVNADAGRAIFWLHGGGYCIGGCVSHRGWAARMAVASAASAYTIDYRLAPEHPFPAAVDDALAAWRGFLAEGHDPKRTVIGGDSAGGGLTMATAVAARDAGLPLPAGLHLVSPWANLTNESPAYAAKGETDFIITQAGIDDFAANYLPGGMDPNAHLASPVFADLTGLPPILIQVGSEEVLMSDSVLLAERAGFAQVDVTLRIWPHMIHIWPFFAQLGAS
ncbi:MAG TPA: alpha/beta hydrolase, partial [Caulobacteraceae bacterium]|nr:alpha/beta hydrolase [Caulobacteraceae bacterium]